MVEYAWMVFLNSLACVSPSHTGMDCETALKFGACQFFSHENNSTYTDGDDDDQYQCLHITTYWHKL